MAAETGRAETLPGPGPARAGKIAPSIAKEAVPFALPCAWSGVCPKQRSSQFIGEHLLIMPVPIALEALLGVVFLFEPKEIDELRVASLDLLSRGPAVVSQVVPASVLDGPVDNPPEVLHRFLFPGLGVPDVQITHDAHRGLARPGEKTLRVLLYEADCAIRHIHVVLQQVLAVP